MRFHAAVLLAASTFFTPAPAFAQVVQQGPKLVGTGAVGAARQGEGAAISADGNTAIVGGSFDDDGAGAAWVFTRSNGVWTQQGPKLIGTGAAGKACQGHAVAISADGNTAIVGGWCDGNGAGASWVFVRSGGVWTQQGPKLVGAGASGATANQGGAVALSADGNTALVGASNDGSGAPGFMGATFVFVRTGSTWVQQGPKLVGTGSAEVNQLQGASVALSADGNTAFIGGPTANVSQGAAWVFVRSGSTWTQQGGMLTPSDAVSIAQFGSSVALSSDGNTAAVGGPLDNWHAPPVGVTGAVWVFTRSGSTWTQQGPKLVGPGGSLANNGISVSLSADGNTLLDGTYGDSALTGGAWVFVRVGTTWLLAGKKLIGTGAVDGSNGAFQGSSVDLSADGRTAIVGGWRDDADAGATWVFRRSHAAGDFDVDTRGDLALYTTNGDWAILTSSSGYASSMVRSWGGAGYAPVDGDFDGDGKGDLGVYQESSGNWYVLLSGSDFTTSMSRAAGGTGWIPVPGDYDGDGKTDFGVYDTTNGLWYALLSGSSYTTTLAISWGGAGYTATPGDFDGDGRTDLGLYVQATGNWYVLLSAANYATSLHMAVGGADYDPAQSDYDGDGKTDFGVYNPTTGLWYALKSGSNYTTTLAISWGGPGYTPIRGDFDGDGRQDLALYHESSGNWYVLLSGANYTTTLGKAWGGPGYVPVSIFP